MNFLKGIVDVILAEDLKDDQELLKNNQQAYQSHGVYSPVRTSLNRTNNQYDSASKLSDIYKFEREKCAKSLIIKYGEGCVQQLSEMLKTNFEAVNTLSKQLENCFVAINDANNQIEAAALEHLRLRRDNAVLSENLEILSSENVNLKHKLDLMNIKANSDRSHIAKLNELLKGNHSTFKRMKQRCKMLVDHKAEIDSLKVQLAMAENHIKMLTKERDNFWDKDHTNIDNAALESSISEALEKRDHAIEIAKMMARETVELTQKSRNTDDGDFGSGDDGATDSKEWEICELKTEIERLLDENSHLKEVNDNLHTMYADLSKASKQLKYTFLQQSVESLASLVPQSVTPVQLIFIQPTGILDLELDLNLLSQGTSDNISFGGENKDHVTISSPSSQRINLQPYNPQKSAESTTLAKKNVWDTDWDVYEELDQQPVEPSPETKVDPAMELHNIPENVSLVEGKKDILADRKVSIEEDPKLDLAKSAAVWNDDFGELFQ